MSAKRTDIARLTDGEGSGHPGLFIDQYGPLARIEYTDAKYAAQLDALCANLPHRYVIALRRIGDGKVTLQTLRGKPPAGLVVHESIGADTLRFWVRPSNEDAAGAGVFADMRLGRRFIYMHAAGGPMCNLFAHAGAFGVAAFAGGAARIDHVDLSRKAASWSATNLALNGAFPRRHRFIVDDAFAYLAKVQKRALKDGPVYQTLVCDPPTTGMDKQKKRFVTKDRLDALAAQCVDSVVDRGVFILSCNDRRLDRADFVRAVTAAAKNARRDLEKVEPLRLPDDFPSRGRNASTRGVVVRLA